MSSVMYPLSVIAKLQQSEMDRTVKDSFEDGGTYARNTWGLQTFKRQFQLQHSALTLAEWNALRIFYRARTGQFDPFWFRNNLDRTGNAKVRFAKSLQPQFSGNTRNVTVDLEEVAAIRCLPDMAELTTAAGSTPLAWYDASREKYLVNLGTVLQPESAYVYDAYETNRATWQAGSIDLGTSRVEQWQNYLFDGTRYAATPAIAGIAGITAATLFVQVLTPTTFSTINPVWIGGSTGGTGFGLNLNNVTNKWFGLVGTTSTAGFAASTQNTWQSLALTMSGTSISIYKNGVLIGTETLGTSLALTSNPLYVGYSPVNALPAISGTKIANAMAFTSQLSGAQIKAIHNLLAYQRGLATA